MRKRRSWEGRRGRGGTGTGEELRHSHPTTSPTPRGAGLIPSTVRRVGRLLDVTELRGSCWCWRASRHPPFPVPSHTPRAGGVEGKHRMPRALGTRQVPALPAAGVGEKSEVTHRGPGGEPRASPELRSSTPAGFRQHSSLILRPSRREKRAGGFSQAEVAGFRAINCSSFISCPKRFLFMQIHKGLRTFPQSLTVIY